MNKKAKGKLVSLGISILIIIMGILYYQRFYNFNNAFDQMYYTRVREEDSFWILPSRGLFSNMTQLESITSDKEDMYTREGIFTEKYKAEYLEENQQLDIDVYRNKEILTFTFVWTFEQNEYNEYDDNIWLTYTYNVQTKELVKNDAELRTTKENDTINITTNYNEIKEALERRSLTYEALEEKQEWFLYERFLTDWFEANKWKTRFSEDNLGEVTIVSEKDENYKNVVSEEN